jgi:hypothetical protein
VNPFKPRFAQFQNKVFFDKKKMNTLTEIKIKKRRNTRFQKITSENFEKSSTYSFNKCNARFRKITSEKFEKSLTFFFNECKNIFDIVLSNPHYPFVKAEWFCDEMKFAEIDWNTFVKTMQVRMHNLETKWNIFFNDPLKKNSLISLFYDEFYHQGHAFFPKNAFLHGFKLSFEFSSLVQKNAFLDNLQVGCIEDENYDTPKDFFFRVLTKEIEDERNIDLNRRTVMVKIPMKIPGLTLFDRTSNQILEESIDEDGNYTYSLLPLKKGKMDIQDIPFHPGFILSEIVPMMNGQQSAETVPHYESYHVNFFMNMQGMMVKRYV